MGLTNCERDANVELPKTDAKLVVTSFISPNNEETHVTVSLSKPVHNSKPSDPYKRINNATVTINGTVIPLIGNGVYSISAQSLPVKAGETYDLSVKTPDGKSVTAQATVPAYPVTKLTVTNIQESIVYNSISMNITVTDDHPSHYNYYALAGRREYKEKGQTYSQKVQLEQPAYFEDDDFVGNKMVFNEAVVWDGKGSSTDNKLIFTLAHTDEHYLKYHRSVYTQDDENPIQDPVLIYSNIDGGYGVFSAFVAHVKEIDM